MSADEIRTETERSYPRVLAERGQSYAAGWLAARNHIAEQMEATSVTFHDGTGRRIND